MPFKGDLRATEAVAGNLHHLAGAGNGTNLGGFTYTADITVDKATGEGKGTVAWTAANGDRVFASTTGEVVLEDFPTIAHQGNTTHHGRRRPIRRRIRAASSSTAPSTS